jgi:hypothetical protein
MAEIFTWSATTISVVAVFFGIISLANSALALRAQARAHNAIMEAARNDEQLQILVQLTAEGRTLSEEQLRMAKDKLRTIVSKLPAERDQIYVLEGVGQANTAGANSYVMHTLKSA